MTTIQKIIKYSALALAGVIIVGIFSAIASGVALLSGLADKANEADPDIGEATQYADFGDISDVYINVDAAKFTLCRGDELTVKSNIKDLKVKEKKNELKIEYSRSIFADDFKGYVILTVPDGYELDSVKINFGAGSFEADTLTCEELSLSQGAGKIAFDSLSVSKCADIEGGAGELIISSGEINDADVEMGAGRMSLSATLLGDCDFEFGVGAADITVFGSRDNYSFDIEKGLGVITLDGENVKNFSEKRKGENAIDIEGGVGKVTIDFEK